jgi:hypothetical protein
MEVLSLDFKFKGERDYIHGTDIYSEITQYLSKAYKPADIDLSFHKVVKNNLIGELYSITEVGSKIIDPVSVFKFTNNSNKYIIKLTEGSSIVKERYEYNEDKLVESAIFKEDEKSITLHSSPYYTNIEKVVALNKALLNKLFFDSGKWYFTRITIENDINKENVDMIKIQLTKNIGSKITKSIILFDDKERGYIYFSKV